MKRREKSRAVKVAITGAVASFALVAALSSSSAAAKAGTNCPTFQVLHNDRIGKAILPAGTYNVRPGHRSNLSCLRTSALFTRFLEDYDGVLPHHWRVVPIRSGRVKFTKGNGRSFRVIHTSASTGEGSSPLGSLCPGSFHVLHDDHIGPLDFPRGYYQFYIPRRSVITCTQASKKFAHFLDIPSGKLPNGWGLRSQRAVFFRKNDPRRKRFRVDPGT
jgi:hypothetical protein